MREPEMVGPPVEAPTQTERELRYRNAQLRKCCGKQGQTIHNLRAELAEVRELHSKIERGDLRRLERTSREQAENIHALEHYVASLEQKLAAEG